ncbi:hypothetical protein HDU97_000925 [Phlyctochytrium planicorne]|nr:hypothetical protein HDU97_000925 [Phlyctochytrium planicorne]
MNLMKNILWLTASCLMLTSQSQALRLNQKALVLSTDYTVAMAPIHTLMSYTIPFDLVIISPANMTQNSLNLEVTANQHGKYHFVVLATGGMIAEFPNGTFASTLSPNQWDELYAYQANYNVRLVALNDAPKPEFGTDRAKAGAFGTGVIQGLEFVDIPDRRKNTTSSGKYCWVAEDAGMRSDFMGLTTTGHLWVTWASQGMYRGFRRVYMTPHVDDFFLGTSGAVNENGVEVVYRTTPKDFDMIKAWSDEFQAKLNPGSEVKMEMAFNGNGILGELLDFAPNYPIPQLDDTSITDAPLDWVKPLGTGYTIWPNDSAVVQPSEWDVSILSKDPLFNYFANNEEHIKLFYWTSHTFTHEILNNNSYVDTTKEMFFTLKMGDVLGFSKYPDLWSPHSIVTPGISGIFNGDALKAMMDSGVTAAVGDSSRNKTLNTENPIWWPMITTVANNGHDGFIVVPRIATNVFFNCTNREYNSKLFNTIQKTNMQWEDIVKADIDRAQLSMLSLSWRPYTPKILTLFGFQFHQANLRTADIPPVAFKNTLPPRTAQLSLVQEWVESYASIFNRMFRWPLLSLAMDELAKKYVERMTYEQANPTTWFEYDIVAGDNGMENNVKGFGVSSSKDCLVPITVPNKYSQKDIEFRDELVFEQVGEDPLTVWVPIRGGEAEKVFNIGSGIGRAAGQASPKKPNSITTNSASSMHPFVIANVEPDKEKIGFDKPRFHLAAPHKAMLKSSRSSRNHIARLYPRSYTLNTPSVLIHPQAVPEYASTESRQHHSNVQNDTRIHLVLCDAPHSMPSTEARTASTDLVNRQVTGGRSTNELTVQLDYASATSPIYTLQSYTIPFDVLIISPTNMTQIPLDLEISSSAWGKYQLIVVATGGMLTALKDGSLQSTLYPQQWDQLYQYQTTYNVRLISLNDGPNVAFGTDYLVSGTSNPQGMEFVELRKSEATPPDANSTASQGKFCWVAEDAGIRSDFAEMTTFGLFHQTAKVVDSTLALEFLRFTANTSDSATSTAGTAAVIYTLPLNNQTFGTTSPKRQQMSFFLSFGEFSPSALLLSHIWVAWGTQGMYRGHRRVMMTPQVDDFFMQTMGTELSGEDKPYRSSRQDLDTINDWTLEMNDKLNTGSDFRVEVAFNGNGILSELVGSNPDYPIPLLLPSAITDAPLDWVKSLGTGYTIWPDENKLIYPDQWDKDALKKDSLFDYFADKVETISAFFWMSHTFTHEILNNNSYSDTLKEMSFTNGMAKALGLTSVGNLWSPNSIVTPGISGLFNGDALKGMYDSGVKSAVGDSSRTKTLNPINPIWWPLFTTSQNNGFDDCSNREANRQIFNEMQGTNMQWPEIIQDDMKSAKLSIMSLSWRPYTNLRVDDLPEEDFLTTFPPRKTKLGLLQEWVEAYASNFQRMVRWPLISVGLDDLSKKFVSRMKYETAMAVSWFEYDVVQGKDGPENLIKQFGVKSQSDCVVPVTVPMKYSAIDVEFRDDLTYEQVGSDPLTVWVPVKGGANETILTVASGIGKQPAKANSIKPRKHPKSSGTLPLPYSKLWSTHRIEQQSKDADGQDALYCCSMVADAGISVPCLETESTNAGSLNRSVKATPFSRMSLIDHCPDFSFASSPIYALTSYAIPYDLLIYTPTNMTVANLDLEVTPNERGRYQTIILATGGLVTQFPNSSYLSTLYPHQWNQIFAYQSTYNVRMVSLNDAPNAAYGTGRALADAVGTATVQGMEFADVSKNGTTQQGKFCWVAEDAGVRSDYAGMKTLGLFHQPGKIVDPALATEFLRFTVNSSEPLTAAPSTAGVIYTIPAATQGAPPRQQMSFFIGFAQWSPSSLLLNHIWVTWGTRGMYRGQRRVIMTPHVDDFFLETLGVEESGELKGFRTTREDLEAIKTWTNEFSAKLNPESDVKVHAAFNGNGILSRIKADAPNYPIPFTLPTSITDAPLDWVKPLGTGYTIWPDDSLVLKPDQWNKDTLRKDSLYKYFEGKDDRISMFYWMSHTFSHEIFNNNSYSDTTKEMTFTDAMAKSLGLPDFEGAWSPHSIVTPGISGIFNGDALKGMSDSGVKQAVGDSSRPKTLNPNNPIWWPMITSTAANGFDGFVVVPRIATNFHQANLRNADLPPVAFETTVPPRTASLSLLQEWVESYASMYISMVRWPLISLSMDDLTSKFMQRMTFEMANAVTWFEYDVAKGDAGYDNQIKGFGISADKDCVVPITFPSKYSAADIEYKDEYTYEQVGIDPVTVWIPVKGGAGEKIVAVGSNIGRPITKKPKRVPKATIDSTSNSLSGSISISNMALLAISVVTLLAILDNRKRNTLSKNGFSATAAGHIAVLKLLLLQSFGGSGEKKDSSSCLIHRSVRDGFHGGPYQLASAYVVDEIYSRVYAKDENTLSDSFLPLKGLVKQTDQAS